MSESRVTWATSVPILVFLGLSVLDLGSMYATDVRQTDVRRASSLNASALLGAEQNKLRFSVVVQQLPIDTIAGRTCVRAADL